ncbi:MAG: hypothetical protein K8W52_42345 [Deltaproteobacteria bacterium]|nr:hypothetical protein [Deltaproteobacteria bacterium]
MKFAKFAILVAGVLGLISFFLPALKGEGEGQSLSLSAMQIVKGVDEIATNVHDAAETTTDEQVKHVSSGVSEIANQIKGFILIMYAPFLVFLAIGGAGVARKRLGRLGGTGALLFGLVTSALSGLVVAAIGDKGGAGIGVYLALIAGLTGMVSGLLVLIKPDRG